MEFIYNISILIYYYAIRIAALSSNKKALLWLEGRKGLFKKLDAQDFKSNNWIWIHCASLGEFEQGRPIIEALKENTDEKILLTFYSPSGYTIRKDYDLADHVTYLPLDTRKNARKFLEIIQPIKVIFVKYEFWYHFLDELKHREIPCYLVSATFRKQQLFFQPWIGKWFRKMLLGFDYIFTIDQASKSLLNTYDINKVLVVGDTRIDRVLEIKKSKYKNPLILNFKQDYPLLIMGSSWEKDEQIIIPYYLKNKSKLRLLIAPHDVSEKNVYRLLTYIKALDENIIVSQYSGGEIKPNTQILILDSIGILSKIYRYAEWVCIGGGFGAGVHNILEPAVYGVPVLFGKKHKKFPEAIGMIQSEGAFTFSNVNEFEAIMAKLRNEKLRQISGKSAAAYIEQMGGVTPKIIQQILD